MVVFFDGGVVVTPKIPLDLPDHVDAVFENVQFRFTVNGFQVTLYPVDTAEQILVYMGVYGNSVVASSSGMIAASLKNAD